VSATVELALERLASFQARAESALQARLPAEEATPSKLHAAMRYAALGAGKRIRPVLCYFAGEAVAVEPARLDGPAAAVEMIHAYSLVHDDLPAMDDDDLRRGRPTTHRAFDEATAILAGDALQVLAFEVLSSDDSMQVEPAARVEMIRILAVASGTMGMAGGQSLDLAAVGCRLSVPEVEEMHRRKTGALIAASVMMAAWPRNAGRRCVVTARHWGSPSRSSTTCWTSRARRTSWASRFAPMLPRTSRPIRQWPGWRPPRPGPWT
jgi:farnesyl diphosphate synthase